MMPTLLREKMVTARKTRSCMTCGATAIHPGEQYRRSTYVYDGRVYDWVGCKPCDEIQDLVYSWWDSPEDGIGADEYVEWAWEFEDDPQHGEAARAFLERRRQATEASGGAR